MKILVTVKEVAEVEGEFEIRGDDIGDQYLEYAFNEWDDYAIEEAVQISEDTDDVEVVTATIGPERSEEAIRTGLAKGADRAVRVWDDAIASAKYLDIEAKAELLAAVVKEEEPDLVLTGVQSGDEANGATGVTLGEKIGFEWAAVVNEFDLDIEDGVASVHRELEGGIEELTDVEMPAVLTIQSGINEPRYASLRGIRKAQQKPLDVQTLDDLDVDESVLDSPLTQTDIYEPESKDDTIIWEDDAEETAGQLADFLREKGVVNG
jgi:electron transfer flavoprotein beta subunit